MKIDQSEAATVAAAFKSKKFDVFMTSGIRICGVKYQFLREEDSKIVLGKKKDEGGITLQSSKTGKQFCSYITLSDGLYKQT